MALSGTAHLYSSEFMNDSDELPGCFSFLFLFFFFYTSVRATQAPVRQKEGDSTRTETQRQVHPTRILQLLTYWKREREKKT